ncbi:MAG: hypothetical protein AYP45_17720 [Candidatus Brocadia carolinensis]|uniref:Uncharacterized protein n=1 Tax=Candidatus Brocadia carolinensis TaxID=1004156 RepID=A0A1V4AP76_9BACT|nr:MAG: hypothetical protein AYP45_17720 [Candidatus Brocadia caroliniensis]
MLMHKNRKISLVKQQHYVPCDLLTSQITLGEKCGRRVRKRTIANLSNCTPREIVAIKLALSHKEDLSALGALSESVELQEGLSVGAV